MAHVLRLSSRAYVFAMCCLLNIVVQAQPLPYQLHFITTEDDAWPERPKRLTYRSSAVTPTHILRIDEPYLGSQFGALHTCVKDLATGAVVGQHHLILPETAVLDDIVHVNGGTYVIYETIDQRTGEVNVYVDRIEMPSGKPEGLARKVGTIQFDPKGLTYMQGLGIKCHTSENQQFTALYFDKIQTGNREQLVYLFMLNSEMELAWSQVYKLAIDPFYNRTSDLGVSNEGIVYALMHNKELKEIDDVKMFVHEHLLFKLTEKSMVSLRPSVSEGFEVKQCAMVLIDGAEPLIGGFYGPTRTKNENTTGYFVGPVDPDLDEGPLPAMYPFSGPADGMTTPMLLPLDDGSLYLTGSAIHSPGLIALEDNLFAALLDDQLEQQWATLIPRAWVYSEAQKHFGYAAFVGNDKLIMMVPESPENIVAHQNGSKLTRKLDRNANTVMTISFSDDGRPTFHNFGGPDTYGVKLIDIRKNDPRTPGPYLFKAIRTQGKKDENGVLIMGFE